MYTNDEEPYYETTEPPHKRPRKLTEVKEQKFFRLEHRIQDEPGVLRLALQEPIRLEADTYYAAVALQNITYSHRWQNLENGGLSISVSVFDSTIERELRDYHRVLSYSMATLHYDSLDELMKLLKTLLHRRVALAETTSSFIDEPDRGMDLEEYLKIDYANNVFSIANLSDTVGFEFQFNRAFQESFLLTENTFELLPFGIKLMTVDKCLNTKNEYISLHLAGLKYSITPDGNEPILHSFTNKNQSGGFNTHTPSPMLDFKELQVPCVIRELCVYVKNIEGENIDFSAEIRRYVTGVRTTTNAIDCIMNLVLVVKKLE